MFRFRKRDDCIYLTSYIGDESVVTVPATFKGLPIIGVSKNCFSKCENEVLEKIKQIILPDTIEIIESYAFFCCVALEKMDFPKNLKILKQNAFENCSNLKEVTFYENVEKISSACFYNCTSLNKITCYSNKVSVGKDAFNWGLPLKEASINFIGLLDSRFQFTITQNLIENFDTLKSDEQKELLSFLNRKQKLKFELFTKLNSQYISFLLDKKINVNLASLTNFINFHIEKENASTTAILLDYKAKNFSKTAVEQLNDRKELVEIGFELPTYTELKRDWSFLKKDGEITIYSYRGISKTQTLPAMISDGTPITKIKISKNSDFSTLENLTIEANLKSICGSTFDGCTNLKSIVLPESVTSIGNGAFYACSCINEMILPPNIVEIYSYAFTRCTELNSITLPEKLNSIGYASFAKCTSLKELTLPQSLTYIGYDAFFGCISLEQIVIPKKVNYLGEKTFLNCLKLKKVEILASVKKLPREIFSGCENLREIELPNTIEEICDFAFDNCKSLEEITLPESLKKIGIGAFDNCCSLKQVNFKGEILELKDYDFVIKKVN